MKRIALYIAALAVALLIPTKGTDIGKLQPVELASIDLEEGWIVLRTDTGDSGIGQSVEEALQNLKDTTAGIVFLDTADYLLTTPEASETAKKLTPYLKGSVRICAVEGNVDLEEAAEYLSVHPPKVILKDFLEVSELQFLQVQNDRLILQ